MSTTRASQDAPAAPSARIRDLFVSDVTRDIPPVVYFHEQSPAKLAAEVSEYIVTGGWPEGHPHRHRVQDGIHEQYVRLLRALAAELDRAGGPDLPAVWISGFYGSGKSSFAKLLGLALDGVALPDGRSLAEAWLARDTSPRAAELREAWRALRQKVEPLAVVFDVGGTARDNEQVHAAALRQVQRRLGYCSTEPLVADFELALERDGAWPAFEAAARAALGRPWAEVKDKALAEEDFSLVLSRLYPDRYPDPQAWFLSRAGTHARAESPEEAVAAIRDMLRFRRPAATLFLVIDEVSQYVLSSRDRVDRLRAFATALGATLRGKAWLFALGQQRLDEEADASFLVWAKDRFPPKLRVHLAPTNIRDVVHKRLLQKRPDAEGALRALFERHRPDLKLYAYGCESVTPDELVEVYPLLPGHVGLLLQITSALRTRSARAQGDDQAIRGLLQLLGELFRDQRLADRPVGDLVTLDQIYEVQHTALDADVQSSMARVLHHASSEADGLLRRAAKAVALLELIQETLPTDARLVAQCLYDRVDRGNQLPAVTEALEELRRRNLLSYSEKQGYKIQSSAGEEWERERREIGVAREAIGDLVQAGLKSLLALPERARLEGRPFPWAARFSDGRQQDDVTLLDPRDDASVVVDLRWLVSEQRTESAWVRKSGDDPLRDRLVWVAGDTEPTEEAARALARSLAMVRKYKARRESLTPARRLLLQQEENRAEDLAPRLEEALAAAFVGGRLYFRARSFAPSDLGAAFATALHAAGTRILPELFPSFVATQLQPAELMLLLDAELTGPSPKLLPGELGILELDSGRFVPACSGVIPRRILEHVEAEGGIAGAGLLTHFGRPPYGYPANVVKACVAGLLRGGKVRIEPDGGTEVTAVRDAGARDLFDKDRAFRRATFYPAAEDEVGPQARARICRLFEERLHVAIEDRESGAIADAVALHFPAQARRLRDTLARLGRLPGSPAAPPALARLHDVLEACLKQCRQTKPTVQLLKRHLDALQDGLVLLHLYDAEITPESIDAVRRAADVRDHQAAQLAALEATPAGAGEAAARVEAHLRAERPWRDVAALDGDLSLLREAYTAERQRLLAWQEQMAEQARARVKGREGFSTLTAEKAHQVLRPLTQAVTDTTPEAVAPALAALRDPFLVALQRAEDRANEILDEHLSSGTAPAILRVDLALRNREVTTEADVEALLAEIRARLLEPVQAGTRVRLV